MNFLAKLLIKAYRFLISPMLPVSCRFTPSCSQYALDAFHLYPFFTALSFSLKRIGRCNPYFEGGYDPLPEPPNKR